jgi:hypothetical protein
MVLVPWYLAVLYEDGTGGPDTRAQAQDPNWQTYECNQTDHLDAMLDNSTQVQAGKPKAFNGLSPLPVSGATFTEVRDSKIVRKWFYWDRLSLLAYLSITEQSGLFLSSEGFQSRLRSIRPERRLTSANALCTLFREQGTSA